MGKATDFRYNTGATRVPWAAVGENYNVSDLMEIIKFLMQGEGPEYDEAIKAVRTQVEKLDRLSTPPGKLSLASKVEAAEEAANAYLGTDSSTFVTNATSGFEIAYKYANLKPGDEVIVPAIIYCDDGLPVVDWCQAGVCRCGSRHHQHGSRGRGEKDHTQNKNDRSGTYRRLSGGHGPDYGTCPQT